MSGTQPNNDIVERSPIRSNHPYTDALAINYTADQVFATIPRAILLTTAGTLKVDTVGNARDAGSTGVSLLLPAGVIIPLMISKIYNAGSSVAVGIVLF